jgi:RNA polymerase sigma factor (sigma-70 family)
MSDTPTDFTTLMARVRSGDQDAMGEMCERYSGHVRRVVRRKLNQRLRGQFDSLDFLQDVWTSFVAVPLENYTFETPEGLILFLSRLACNKVVEAYRTRVGAQKRTLDREAPLPDAVPAPLGRQPTPSQVVMADERWAQLLEGLAPKQRKVVDLLRQGHTHLEISEIMGVHVKVIQRLIRKLWERLES